MPCKCPSDEYIRGVEDGKAQVKQPDTVSADGYYELLKAYKKLHECHKKVVAERDELRERLNHETQ